MCVHLVALLKNVSAHATSRHTFLCLAWTTVHLDEPFPVLKDYWEVCMCRAAHTCVPPVAQLYGLRLLTYNARLGHT